MSLFKRENRDAALGNLTDLLALREGGLRNYSGEEVNEQSALGISAVFSAISLLADSIALLPMKTLRYDAQKVIFTDKPKFLEKPNVAQDISMFSLVHQTISTLAMHGNAFILVDRDRQGRPIQLTPIHPEKVKVEMKDTWLGNHNRNRKPAVLTGGLKWKAISAAAGNELIDAREQITHEIARVFRIPAHLLLAKDGSNVYSNLESNGLAFIRHTLLPWIRRIEDSFTTLLPGKQFVRLDTDEYARGDQLSRVRSFQVAISSGMMTPNEARAKLDLEPYEGGDKFYIGLQGALIDPTLPPQGVDEHDPTNTLLEE
jgi:phage portal protein BeeE